MSHRFKPPKMRVKEGSDLARLIRSAKRLNTQAELDAVLAQVDPQVGREWLELMRPHFNFVPLQFQTEPIRDIVDDS